VHILRITGDTKSTNPNAAAPSDILGGIGNGTVLQADEDDISLLWLNDESQSGVSSAVSKLETNAKNAGFDGGEIFYGPPLDLMFNDPSVDSRTPDIIITPNVGVIYTGGTKKVAEHGGFAHDDTDVMMLVANPKVSPSTVTTPVQTTQIAPTILKALGLEPSDLQAVQKEATQLLPGLQFKD
jgi:hypothetical protein